MPELGFSKYQWLWFLVAAGLAVLLLLWLLGTWEVESDVAPGAGPDGLTYPANPGFAVEAPREPAVDVELPAVPVAEE